MVESKVISDTTPTTAAGASASAATMTGLDQFESGLIVAELAGATGGTLDVYLQVYEPISATWYDYLHFAQLAAGGAAVIKAVTVKRSSERTATVTIGKNASPALAVDTCVGGDFGDTMRAFYVPGATTTAGAAVTIRFMGTKLTR